MKSIIQYVVFSIIFLAAPSPYAQETQSLGQLKLEKRQPDTSMNVTSVNLGREEFIITGETDMEAYGHVYGIIVCHITKTDRGGQFTPRVVERQTRASFLERATVTGI